MNQAKYPSKERVVRNDVLVYAEGDDIPLDDLEELHRQGYEPETEGGAATVRATERIVQDDVLLYAEGDEIPADVADRLGIRGQTTDEPAPAPEAPATGELVTGADAPKGRARKGK